MSAQRDVDPAETREWLDSLDGIIEVEGQDRAAFLLDELLDRARRRGTPVPYSAATPYLNTIPPDREAQHPGDRAIEHRIRSYIRWNALAIVLRANKESSELGGHIATFQSAATLYDIGFMHFWRAPSEDAWRRPGLHPGPLLARHLRARLPRRPADRGAARSTSARKSTARACPPIRIPG